MDPRAEWPMDFYISAWRLFRRLSDENRLTADHLLSRPKWPREIPRLTIVDFGCGDGTLLESLILASSTPVDVAHLVDPDPDLLNQAKSRIAGLDLIGNVQTTLARAEDVAEPTTADADVALAVHLVYLLNNGQLQRLLDGMRPNIPLFIVMDEERSVFVNLWERTAPKYHRRLLLAHKAIQSLDKDKFSFERTGFDTHLTNPFSLRTDMRDFVLSLLCYADFKALGSELQNWARSVLQSYVASSSVVCNCVCYEVVKLVEEN